MPKSAGINDTLVPNTTALKYGSFGIRAMTGKRVAANTIEAVRRCAANMAAAKCRSQVGWSLSSAVPGMGIQLVALMAIPRDC